MAKIIADFNETIGKIKPVNGVGQPPIIGSANYSMFHYLKEANIPYSRLHDVGGPYGGNINVDIPNIFRDFDADPEDPNAYDFAFTDALLAALAENGVEPYYRLGVTIENYTYIKALRIYPPEDNLKWAKICEGIIKHYTEGWANGFNYKIEYWEIWNEPDSFEDPMESCMWRGTKEQYFELYNVASKYLKGKFPHLKIGGYAACGFCAITNGPDGFTESTPRFDYFLKFFHCFLEYVKEHNCPLDFFSWHSYEGVKSNKLYSEYARKCLDEAGFTNTEISCNEWHSKPGEYGTIKSAAINTAMLIMFQHAPVTNAMFYDARCGASMYGGMFEAIVQRPYPLYYGFYAFGQLYKLGNEVKSLCDNEDVYVLAASDGQNSGLLIANIGEETELELDLNGKSISDCFVIDNISVFTPCRLPKVLKKESVVFVKVE